MTAHEAPDPFDAKDGDESWRKVAEGRVVYTGDEFVKVLRPPTAAEEAYRQDFWDKYEVQRVQSVTAVTPGRRQGLVQPQPAAVGGEHHFTDAHPARSATPNTLLDQHQISAPLPALPSLPAPGALASRSATTSASASAPAPRSGLSLVLSASTQHSPDIDGEYEIDDDFLLDAPPGPLPLTSIKTVAQESAPRTSSPRTVDHWDDTNLLTLWKHKVIRKKGYEPMLTSFKKQTAKSLHEAWTTHKARCKLLGAAWEAAGKPNSPLSERFEG